MLSIHFQYLCTEAYYKRWFHLIGVSIYQIHLCIYPFAFLFRIFDIHGRLAPSPRASIPIKHSRVVALSTRRTKNSFQPKMSSCSSYVTRLSSGSFCFMGLSFISVQLLEPYNMLFFRFVALFLKDLLFPVAINLFSLFIVTLSNRFAAK